ncbi:MAG: shikimate dehydrogenase [Bacteroidota bacterium]
MEQKQALVDIDRLFGLIGYPLSHSFSKGYFAEKFQKEHIEGAFYESFPLAQIEALPQLLREYPNLVGLNVTIPYKEQVLPYLTALDADAATIGAVNTILINGAERKGYNTDIYGFETSLVRLFAERQLHPQHALVLGTGGAAKAITFVLDKLAIDYQFVSRTPKAGQLTYDQLDEEILRKHTLIVNTTPLGMYPNVAACPNIPYNYISEEHLGFDLIYNPAITQFMQQFLNRGAAAKNGLEMLHLQAEKAWEIWNATTP